MKTAFILFALLFSSSYSWAGSVECTVYMLGSGLDNIIIKSDKTTLAKSPSGLSDIGQIKFQLPSKVPVNGKKTDAPLDYEMKIDLRLTPNQSAWELNYPTLYGYISVTHQNNLIGFQEISSDVANSQSHLRILKQRKVIPFVSTLYAPSMYKKIMELKSKVINVSGIDITVEKLLTELGMVSTVENLAERELINNDEVTGWTVNCSHQ